MKPRLALASAPVSIAERYGEFAGAARTQPSFSALFALNMALSAEHGWVFSDEDLQGWLKQAGFGDYACRPLPAPLPHWLASATKI